MRHLRNFIFLSALIICLQTTAFCQRDSVRVKVFDGTQTQPLSTSRRSYDDKNYLRFNFYMIPRGAFVFGYERVLSDKHAVTFDIGLTHRDFIYEFSLDEGFDFEGSETKIGHYIEVAYKFYPKDYQDFDGGIYLSPGYITRNYNVTKDVDYYNGSTTQSKPVDVSYRVEDIYLRFGYGHESWAWNDVIADIYFGLGYRQITSNSYTINTTTLGVDQIKTIEETKARPALYVGARIGFSF